jgi:hypothetical protein
MLSRNVLRDAGTRRESVRQTIPNPVIAVVAEVLGEHYYSHSKLNTLFMEAGAPG